MHVGGRQEASSVCDIVSSLQDFQLERSRRQLERWIWTKGGLVWARNVNLSIVVG